MNTPINVRVGDILVQYALRVGVGPGVIGRGIYFLFNGRKIKKEDEKKTIQNLGIYDNSHIIVVDPDFVIGA